jgi:hypothetical protein
MACKQVISCKNSLNSILKVLAEVKSKVTKELQGRLAIASNDLIAAVAELTVENETLRSTSKEYKDIQAQSVSVSPLDVLPVEVIVAPSPPVSISTAVKDKNKQVEPPFAEQITVIQSPSTSIGEWSTVKKRSPMSYRSLSTGNESKRPSLQTSTLKKICGSKPGSKSCSGVEKRRSLHIWSLHPDTTVSGLTDYVKESVGDVKFEVIKLNTKNKYSSFRITVPESSIGHFLVPEIWPVDSIVNEWRWNKLASPHTTSKSS